MSSVGPTVDEYHNKALGGDWVRCGGCPAFRIFDFHYYYCRHLGDQSKPDTWPGIGGGWHRLQITNFNRAEGARAPCEPRQGLSEEDGDMTTPTQQWSDWIPWHGGPCPIHDPDVSIGIRLRAGDEVACVTGPATDWRWSNTNTKGDIVAYRYRICPTEAPAEPSPSLVEAAEAMAAALRGYEQWEGDIILNGDWGAAGMAPTPRMTQAQWDQMIELQSKRNTALALYSTTSKEG